MIQLDYKNGEYDGKWIGYYENGNLNHEWYYKDGKKEGKWTLYNENGSIDKVEQYKDGELVE
jgi:antitoxin component YwqK of YwqJK toxin-antitoxin module